ncbi:MAG: glycosyltransferase family 2 protein [Magnetococcales bacterium]|nr:glycosyltransferase family 2 protein [Magnetococcales bacterium]
MDPQREQWQRPASLPTVSVVIPVRNEAARLEACLAGILEQTHGVLEIIVIDSGSTDGTCAMARAHSKVRMIEIPPAEFSHGATRNLGCRESRGELVLFTVGDAWARDADWIQRLVAALADPEVDAAWGTQVVPSRPEFNPLDWYRPRSTTFTPVRFQFPLGGFDRLAPEQKKAITGLDDVTALYRRSALLERPHPPVSYGEDILWAVDTLRLGRALVFDPGARVFHYHVENHHTIVKKTITVACLRYALLGYVTPAQSFLLQTLRAWLRLIRVRELSLDERLRWAVYNLDLYWGLTRALARFNAAAAQGPEAVTRLGDRYGGLPPMPVK